MNIEIRTTTTAQTMIYNIIFWNRISRIIIISTLIEKVNNNPRRIVKSDLVKKAKTVSAINMPRVNIAAISTS